ncbi:MAG: dual specificity protein phosphatase family protein [Sandaracinaceae bacterium]|nr:dual specificity protein phosphatase family protein [Sandaracinaceae bacterium]
MRFGLIQVALGIALIGVAAYVGDAAWALVWPGWSVGIVGLAYLGIGPRVFGKRADGGMSMLHVALLLPYYVVAWSLWQLKSRLQGENPHDEVAPGIIVGRRPLGEAEMPAAASVVVDLTSEFPRSAPTRAVARYECVPTLDTDAPDVDAFRALLDRLDGEEGPIFVHCAMGHGRSATVAAGLMVRRGVATDVDDAIRRMTAARPRVHLHGVQRAAVGLVSMKQGELT